MRKLSLESSVVGWIPWTQTQSCVGIFSCWVFPIDPPVRKWEMRSRGRSSGFSQSCRESWDWDGLSGCSQIESTGPRSHSWATPEGSTLSNAVACWQEQLLVESINSDTPAAGIKKVSAFKGGSGQSTTVSTTIRCYVHDHIASKRLEFKPKSIWPYICPRNPSANLAPLSYLFQLLQSHEIMAFLVHVYGLKSDWNRMFGFNLWLNRW